MTAPARIQRPDPPQTQKPRHDRILDCLTCGTPTRHVLTLDGTMYVCACGSFYLYFRNLNPKILG